MVLWCRCSVPRTSRSSPPRSGRTRQPPKAARLARVAAAAVPTGRKAGAPDMVRAHPSSPRGCSRHAIGTHMSGGSTGRSATSCCVCSDASGRRCNGGVRRLGAIAHTCGRPDATRLGRTSRPPRARSRFPGPGDVPATSSTDHQQRNDPSGRPDDGGGTWPRHSSRCSTGSSAGSSGSGHVGCPVDRQSSGSDHDRATAPGRDRHVPYRTEPPFTPITWPVM
jgi:hypothetical protein